VGLSVGFFYLKKYEAVDYRSRYSLSVVMAPTNFCGGAPQKWIFYCAVPAESVRTTDFFEFIYSLFFLLVFQNIFLHYSAI
jgi:hypothetical protein